jgi:hypothetical protein
MYINAKCKEYTIDRDKRTVDKGTKFEVDAIENVYH